MQYCIHCGEKNADDARECTKCDKPLDVETRPAGESAADALDELDARATVIIEQGVSAGQTLAGRYELVRELGRGAMGIVFFAKDRVLEMDVAVKVLPPVLAHDPRSIKQLKNEAQAAMRLSHPNVVRLHNFEQSDEAVFLVMEYVEGTDLLTHLTTHDDDKLPVGDFEPLAEQIIDAVAHAHDAGIVHKDLKPANIMLTVDGNAKVADFGIAHIVRETVTRVSRVETAGTLLYMAPEVLRGERGTPKSDQYALACTFYEMLVGEPPFMRGDITYQHVNVPPTIPEELPAHIRTALSIALEKDPEKRLGDVRLLGEALKEPAAGHEPTPDVPPPVEASTVEKAATPKLDDTPPPDPKSILPQDGAHLNGKPRRWPKVLLLMLLAVTAAIVGLAMLGDVDSKDYDLGVEGAVGNVEPAMGTKDPLPDGGALPSDAPTGLERTQGDWTIQLGPYSGPDEAWPIYERWQARGMFSYIHSPLGKDREVLFSAVWLGRYLDRREANEARDYLARRYSDVDRNELRVVRTDL